MVLTVVVGSSGSGKTTLLEDVHKINDSIYIRQYHTLRPYMSVNSIPKFDATRLPFWSNYSQEQTHDGDAAKRNVSYDPNIRIGGTLAGEFTPGLSGGQRKMLLFELVSQRIANTSGLLVCLDEPFAGVTDDFVPFIIERLQQMSESHNVLLVTNDHVAALTELANSTITVSAIDLSKVKVNGTHFHRETTLHAVSFGKHYQHELGNEDIRFFLNTEVSPFHSDHVIVTHLTDVTFIDKRTRVMACLALVADPLKSSDQAGWRLHDLPDAALPACIVSHH